MALDIKAKVEELVGRITGDKSLLENFKSEPVKTVEGLLGKDLPDETVQKIADGVKAKIGADKLSGLLGGLFGKK